MNQSVKNIAGVTFRQLALTGSAITFSVIVGEYVQLKRKSEYRPSRYISIGADKTKKIFSAIGEYAAWVSSYLTKIDLKEVSEAVVAVGGPTFNIAVSPIHLIIGYAKAAAAYKHKDWMIYLGSFLLVLLSGYSLGYLSRYYPRLNFWTPIFLSQKKFWNDKLSSRILAV